ncbi:MAG: putative porin [Desulfobulbaceae bacterium]|nr:putative porin [Desulfobulbaceae bacterium]
MKKTLKITALLATSLLFPAMASAGAATEEEILNKLEYLTNKVMAQQEHIDSLEAQQGQKSTETGNITLANSAIDQLKIKGDLRLRYEHRDRSRNGKTDDNKNRLRSRVRIGGVWQNKVENFEVGVGLASGGSDATSTNATWSDSKVFETSDIRLDYAYAKHTMGNFAITAGQQKNPYETSWLFWDGDVRPIGLTLQYGDKTGPFVTGGVYAVRYYGGDGDSNNETEGTGMLGAGQVGWNAKIGDMKLLAAAGLQNWESSIADEYYGDTVGDDYKFMVGDIYAKLTIPAGKEKIDLYTQIWQNFGADGNVGQGTLGGTLDPEAETLGYVLGAQAKIGAVKVSAAYAHVEADSMFGKIKDADFGTGLDSTNVEGFKLGASYGFTKNWSMGVTGQFYATLEDDGTNNDGDEVKLYQVDMKYKF